MKGLSSFLVRLVKYSFFHKKKYLTSLSHEMYGKLMILRHLLCYQSAWWIFNVSIISLTYRKDEKSSIICCITNVHDRSLTCLLSHWSIEKKNWSSIICCAIKEFDES